MTATAYTLYGIAIFFMIAWAVLWIIHAIALSYSRWKFHRKTTVHQPNETPYPGVSIVKPLLGVDPNLFSNLETFFTMKYPIYELLFCVEDEHDPAAMLVNSLMTKYPEVEARIFIGGSKIGVNPKINNMHAGYEAARHDLVLISDAGIRMKEDTLLNMVSHLSEKVALVHQMPFACDREGFAATYEKVFFGTVQARMYLAADFLRINCHVGMSSLVRKSALAEAGGLAAFGDYLAEDYFMAEALTSRGWRMRVCEQPAMQNSGGGSVAAFQARLQRWTRLRVAMLPLTTLLEPVSECLPLGAAAAWSSALLFDCEPFAFFLVHALVWFLSDWLLLSTVQQGPLPFSKADFALGWLWRELCGPPLFIAAVFTPEISWRSRRYRLDWGGRAHELKPKVKF